MARGFEVNFRNSQTSYAPVRARASADPQPRERWVALVCHLCQSSGYSTAPVEGLTAGETEHPWPAMFPFLWKPIHSFGPLLHWVAFCFFWVLEILHRGCECLVGSVVANVLPTGASSLCTSSCRWTAGVPAAMKVGHMNSLLRVLSLGSVELCFPRLDFCLRCEVRMPPPHGDNQLSAHRSLNWPFPRQIPRTTSGTCQVYMGGSPLLSSLSILFPGSGTTPNSVPALTRDLQHKNPTQFFFETAVAILAPLLFHTNSRISLSSFTEILCVFPAIRHRMVSPRFGVEEIFCFPFLGLFITDGCYFFF